MKRTYSKSAGWLLTPRAGGAIQLANRPGSVTRPISDATYAPSTSEASQSRCWWVQWASLTTAFWGWNRIWLDPDFRAWNIEEYLPRIACPVLAIQGKDDEYGTREQLERIGRQVADVELRYLEDCRHSAPRDQPQTVIDAITRFVDRVTGA